MAGSPESACRAGYTSWVYSKRHRLASSEPRAILVLTWPNPATTLFVTTEVVYVVGWQERSVGASNQFHSRCRWCETESSRSACNALIQPATRSPVPNNRAKSTRKLRSVSYQYNLTSWPEFLDDSCEHWPTDQDHTYVDFIRDREEGPPDRTGSNKDFRLTEKWTSSAKSVFQFDVQGSVAKSTHAGIPWLRHIRNDTGDKVHFWPFDGWDVPDGKSVVAEI